MRKNSDYWYVILVGVATFTILAIGLLQVYKL